MKRRFVLLVAGLAGVALMAVACGGGGGGDDEQPADPLAVLEGTWLGRSLGGSLQLTFTADGVVTLVLRNGVNTGETGVVQHVDGRVYAGDFSGGGDFRLALDQTFTYATFFGDPFLAALQKGATAIPPSAVTLPDIAPSSWAGTHYTIDATLALTNPRDAVATIDATGIVAGTDTIGFTFGSAPGQPLAAMGTYFFGTYRDSAHATTGGIDVVPSPDDAYVAVAAFPVTNTIITNAAFVGGWSRQ